MWSFHSLAFNQTRRNQYVEPTNRGLLMGWKKRAKQTAISVSIVGLGEVLMAAWKRLAKWVRMGR